MREFSTVDQSQMRTRGEGVQNPGNFADVIYVRPLAVALSLLFLLGIVERSDVRVQLGGDVLRLRQQRLLHVGGQVGPGELLDLREKKF